mmetsp:Transcript_14557/g.31710  ORF Transcript_14557/g.31710 Transcript_14557/m.31710 type:complete len:380 (+) Transcript_14557:167-1306(+)
MIGNIRSNVNRAHLCCLVLVFAALLPSLVLTNHQDTPWLAPEDTSFPYKGLEHNLVELVKVQASTSKWITLMTFTGAIKRFVLNCIYSMTTFGRQPHYLVATFDPESLALCIKLNLPCYNASSLSQVRITNEAHPFDTPASNALWWAKQQLTFEILSMGYNVHGSDADVVYFREILPSYQHIFDQTWADGAFLMEEAVTENPEDFESYINLMNAGVYALKSSPRVLKFVHHWLRNLEEMDQVRLNNLMGAAYMLCESRAMCHASKRHHKAAFYRHPHIFPGTSCTQPFEGDPCDERRLYIHFLCESGWDRKAGAWSDMQLWLVDEQGVPLWSNPAAGVGGAGKPTHPFLPCQGLAWQNVGMSPNRRRWLRGHARGSHVL